jgi:asparagine synthase (glutamine-hydrolysing)
MGSLLAHRGPDDAGFALADSGQVGLSCVRLRIVDLQGGDQPIANEDGSLLVVSNGEIYDHAALRRDLVRSGHSFRSASDTEVLLHLYEELGDDFLSRLNGEFAFVLWDQRRRRLLAARDRMGVRPLFYKVSAEEILFASEAKAILGLERVERKLSPEYVVALQCTVPRPSSSPFAGIAQLRPGNLLVADDQGVREIPFARPLLQPDPKIGFVEARQEIRRLLREAVRRRLAADVPVSAYLSGGLDSSVVCALMAAEVGPFPAHHVAFPSTRFDESSAAAKVAHYLGLHFDPVDCTPQTLAENVVPTLYHTESVPRNPNSVAKFLLSRHVHQQGRKVCLTGEGADEVFGGYPSFGLQVLRELETQGGHDRRRVAKLRRTFYSAHALTRGISWEPLPRKVLSAASPYWLLANHVLSTRKAIGPNPDGLRRRLLMEHFNDHELSSLDGINALRSRCFASLSAYILPLLGDRVEMAHAIECRTPFLDPELIAFAARLPTHYLVDRETLREKLVLLESCKDLLPPDWRRQKLPITAPSWEELLSSPAGTELVENHLTPQALAHAGLFWVPAVQALRAFLRVTPRATRLHRRAERVLGRVLGLQILHRLFVAGRPTGNPDFVITDRSPLRAGAHAPH